MNLIQAEKLAMTLMAQHGVNPKLFKFTDAQRTFGHCGYKKFRGKYVCTEIALSRPLTLLNEESEVRDTILHEIAHALTLGNGHNSVWKRKCVEIGCRPQRCYTTKDVVAPPHKYQAECGTCRNVAKRYRKPSSKISCGRCSNKYDERYLLNFEKIN